MPDISLNKLTVRIYPARDVRRCWIARIRLDDGKPLRDGENAWITQGRSPSDAVWMAADVCRLLTGECVGGNRKHRWRPKANASPGRPPVAGRYCPRCETWERRRGRAGDASPAGAQRDLPEHRMAHP